MTKRASYVFLQLILIITFSEIMIGCKNPKAGNAKIAIQAPFKVEIQLPVFQKKEFNVLDFGAKPDSVTMNTIAIRNAIEACYKQGGGTVIFPKGIFFTGAIRLKSNVRLHLEEGAQLIFSDKRNDYLPAVKTRWEGIDCYNYSPLIYAVDCENIAITGKGKINGNGESWWELKKTQGITLKKLYSMVLQNIAPDQRILIAGDSISHLRPSLIEFVNCKNIMLEDFSISSGPMWTIHLVYSRNVYAKRLKVVTHGVNNDGIIPDSSEDVLIDSCYFSTGDDCIVIKSGLNEDGWRVNKPSRNIVVRNCFTNEGHGGVVVGSEMSGGVENIFVENCVFHGTSKGIRIKSLPGRGGFIRNLYFNNIRMDSIKNEVIEINLNYQWSSIPPNGSVLPKLSGLYISNITCQHADKVIRFSGLPDSKISHVNLSNISATARQGMEIDYSENINFKEVHLLVAEQEFLSFRGNAGIMAEHSTVNNRDLQSVIVQNTNKVKE